MLGIPEMYRVGERIDVKKFAHPSLKPNEKKRIKESLKEAYLEYQISGEDIPSLISESYDCQAILFFDMKLDSIRSGKAVGDIVQKLGKPFYVIRFHDHRGMELYHYAHKRLSAADRSEVVVLDTVSTEPSSVEFEDDINVLIEEYATFENIRNKADKRGLYIELMVKSYVVSNMDIWSKTGLILDSKIWYSPDTVLEVFQKLKRAAALKREQKRSLSVSEKSKISSELREIYEELESMIKGR